MVAVANELSLASPWQANVPGEHVPRLSIAVPSVAVPRVPMRIVIARPLRSIRGLPLVPWTAAKRPGIIVIAVVRAAAASAARRVDVALIVARVDVTRVEVKHADLVC